MENIQNFSELKNVQLSIALNQYANQFGVTLDSLEFAEKMDEIDPIGQFRNQFNIPKLKDLPSVDTSLIDNADQECVYLCGNSLGLQPKRSTHYLNDVMYNWANMGVLTHFNGKFPAAQCDVLVKESLAKIVGAFQPEEVVCMNGLTVNIHLLFVSFYRPTADRYKIVIDGHAFPSDRYAMVSQLKLHGYTEEEGLIVIDPRPNEHILRIEDILDVIDKHGDEIAVIFLSGVQYYTGQKFDIETITMRGQRRGCLVGWDLAHAVGNVRLKLHEWNVDFACWCTYKYLNSGAGGIGGAFVHQKHHLDNRSKLAGWWSNKEETRFAMKHHIDWATGADAYRLCNPPPFLVALHKAALEIFDEIGMDKLLDKQYLLTGYLEYLLDQLSAKVELITPRDPDQRGSQLSIIFPFDVKDIHDRLEKRGVVCDVRLPSVMRLSPVASYTTYADVYRFYTMLKQVMDECQV